MLNWVLVFECADPDSLQGQQRHHFRQAAVAQCYAELQHDDAPRDVRWLRIPVAHAEGSYVRRASSDGLDLPRAVAAAGWNQEQRRALLSWALAARQRVATLDRRGPGDDRA